MICRILPEKCIACGLCQLKAPDYFDYYDNGLVKFSNTEKTEQLVADNIPEELLEAYRVCPTRAILLLKED
ncbi:ferredoxin [Vagococcus silagei]|uniref:Ferredoxin n=1 Tax=Vagococcus silagei TaxID=2508885 RepID=A0A4S3B3T6_9ENTE|nr:ferredoxin [Vagococcus silagei]THB61472.1 ferredoxin [Vagococcus silagei]